ncbi:TPA: hypothetical protein ACGORX_001868, partial [Streptococcus suis]
AGLSAQLGSFFDWRLFSNVYYSEQWLRKKSESLYFSGGGYNMYTGNYFPVRYTFDVDTWSK